MFDSLYGYNPISDYGGGLYNTDVITSNYSCRTQGSMRENEDSDDDDSEPSTPMLPPSHTPLPSPLGGGTA